MFLYISDNFVKNGFSSFRFFLNFCNTDLPGARTGGLSPIGRSPFRGARIFQKKKKKDFFVFYGPFFWGGDPARGFFEIKRPKVPDNRMFFLKLF